MNASVSAEEQNASRASAMHPTLLLAMTFSALGVGLALPALALAQQPLWLACGVPFGVFGLFFFLSNTTRAICIIAFSIAPLGIVQHEFAGITLNLPEAMILLLFAKEALVFIAKGERISRDFPIVMLTIYIAASFIGVLTGLERGNHFTVVLQDFRQYFEFITLYLIVLHRVKTRFQVESVLFSFLMGLIILAIHGIIQRYTGWGISSYQLMSDEIYHGAIRSGSFYGATPLGALMVLAVGVSSGLFMFCKSRAARAFILVCGTIALAAAVFTYTRASWIAIVVTLIVVFFGIKKTPLLLAGAALFFVIFSIAAGSIVIHRMGKTEVSKKERSMLERLDYYTAAWRIFQAHPYLGLGWGCEFSVTDINLNGRYVPAPHRFHAGGSSGGGDSSASSQYLQSYKAVLAQSTVHSAYLQILVRAGLLGLIPFLLFMAPWLWNLYIERGNRNHNPYDHNLYIGVAAGVFGYLIHALVENFFQWPVMSQSLWLLLGITTVMAAELKHNGALAPRKFSTKSVHGEAQ
jgi:O-antigen ligase